jgi:hypothetical protein
VIHRLCLPLIVCLLAPAALAAQHERQDSVHLRNKCRLAIQIVSTGHPAPHQEWAVGFVRACGTDGARAFARMLESLRTSSDSALLRTVTFAGRSIRDRTVFQTAEVIAADPGASEFARAYAFRVLTWLVNPAADLEQFDPWAGPELACSPGLLLHPVTFEGEPLPPDYRERVRELSLRVFRDRSIPDPIRYSARCTVRFGGWLSELQS